MFNENISGALKPKGDEKQNNFGLQSSEIQTHREAAFYC